MAILNRFSAILLHCDSTRFFDSRCGKFNFLAIPGPRFWKSCDSRFCAAFARVSLATPRVSLSLTHMTCRSMPNMTGTKKEHKLRMSCGGVGVFHVKGWGPKSSVCHSEPKETKLFSGISRDFCQDILGAPEKFEKTKFVFYFGP